ncbi:MAG TPA: hypothetical protein VF762_14205, partial [Blastocatellia bacterium]
EDIEFDLPDRPPVCLHDCRLSHAFVLRGDRFRSAQSISKTDPARRAKAAANPPGSPAAGGERRVAHVRLSITDLYG